jgi:iron complex outermembrane receptor protein
MQVSTPRKLALAVAAHAALLATQAPIASAQESQLEEVVVTGSRGQARSVFDSSAPIDVLGGEEFRNQGASDMTTLLRNSVPSFNVNSQPISDAATVVRPRQPARPGAGPHAGARQRQASPSCGGNFLAR